MRRMHRGSAASTMKNFSGAAILDYAGPPIADEWQAISLNYTSGTTGDPKGVVYHHRGAYLNAIGDILTCGVNRQSVYLWTLPMFHCNGWCFTWGVTAACGTHVCLRKVDPALIYPLIKRHGVTHMCGAPIVMNLLANAPASVKIKFDHRVEITTGGAAPPSAIIEAMENSGFRVTHMYGLTETYGPATVCAWQTEWDGMALGDRSRKMARQGVPQPTMEADDGCGSGNHGAGAAGWPGHRRAHAPRQHGGEGLPEESEGDGGGIPGRLVPHRRSRRAPSRWLRRG